jgi:hypothetical protein
MSNYIARVELHSADSEDYEVLHSEMEKRGYARTVLGSDGFTYELPTGTYVIRDTSVTVDGALRRAVEAANATGNKNCTIVADWKVAAWQGLRELASICWR